MSTFKDFQGILPYASELFGFHQPLLGWKSRQNTTNALVNYEFRRKMRKVGIQMQDIGVQLCWHTFVDDPSHELGIAQLVHIAQPSDLTDALEHTRSRQHQFA